MYADVIINRRVAAVDRIFTYEVPEFLAPAISLGSLVRVPFGRETIEAVVVGIPEQAPPGMRIRAIKELAAERPLLPPELLKLSRWLADYYLCPWVTAMQAMLPAGIMLSGKLPQSLGPTPGDEPARIQASELSAAQQAVYEDIRREWQQKERPYLLFGVTGSGKTELYLRLIEDMLAEGKQSIVLVPEIALSGQMLAMLRQRLSCRVEVLHSGLTQRERRLVWQDIAAGKVEVIVGARSAVFAPAPRLGLIVLDEEHEGCYKQENVPRFHARAVARERCRLGGAHLVLGSATPSVESYAAAISGEYALGRLPQHFYPAPPPRVQVVDMREELRNGNRSIFSTVLIGAVGEAIGQGEQAILFLNRRGYYQFFSCRSCGTAITCPHCNVAMSYHSAGGAGRLKCHYCGRELVPMSVCPACGSKRIRSFGAGTQRVEAELGECFPGARILRLDSDTTAKRGEHQRIYHAIHQGEADILVGTQMVAKGLDFPNVSVAAALAADSLLNLPDWRAAERTYQLLSQLTGRAGRRYKRGLAIIQTYTPEALAVRAAAEGNYEGFFEAELQTRLLHGYPPAGSLLRLLLTAREEGEASRAAHSLAYYLRQKLPPDTELCGPAAAPLERIKDRWRWQIILKGAELTALREATLAAARCWREEEKPPAELRLAVDVEPFDML